MNARLLRWGNSYGLRLSKAEVERLGLKEGQDVRVAVQPQPTGRVDLSWLRKFPGMADLAEHHDEVEWA